MGPVSVLVVLSDRVLFGSQVPIDVDRAHVALPVILGVGLVIDLHQSFVTLGDIGTDLGTREVNAIDVFELRIRVHASVLTFRKDGFDVVQLVVGNIRLKSLHC
jgi:hypothetical protein